MKRSFGMAISLVVVCLAAGATLAQQTSNLSTEEIEKFLLTAKIGPRKPIGVGINNTNSAVLDDGKFQHRAHIAVVDIAKASFQSTQGTKVNFKDTWKFNIAAYELAKLLQFELVPPSVQRRVAGDDAAVTWWIDDAMMELDRKAKKISPPDSDSWNKQMYAVRVFNQLIYNDDPNLTNLLITKDWNIWMIDHTRAFLLLRTLGSPQNLVQSDRKVLANLRKLDKPLLTAKLGRWLTSLEIEGVLGRRDRIVEFFDKEIASKGEATILFDLPPRKF